MSDKALEKYHQIIDEQIKKVAQGVAFQKDLQLFQDLKRLGDLGVLTIYESHAPDPAFEMDQGAMKVSVPVPHVRLMWEGESRLVEAYEKIKQLQEERDEELKLALDRMAELYAIGGYPTHEMKVQKVMNLINAKRNGKVEFKD